MEKNPVSFLQEHMQKLRVLPNYTIIQQCTGTHVNSFIIRVSCNELFADGSGSSKKEAKVNAALKMISLLKINRSSSNNINHNSANSADSSTTSSPLKSASSSGINYIGKLQEYAAAQPNGLLPNYELKNAYGPQHHPEFTMACTYQGHSIITKGNSKKEAKMLAAQKMYNKVCKEVKVVPSEMELNSYIDLVTQGLEEVKIFNSNKKLMEESTEKALENYLKLTTKVVNTQVVKQDTFEYYHTQLKNKYSTIIRESVIAKLNDTMEVCKSCLSLDEANSNAMVLLENVLKYLNVNMRKEEINTKNKVILYSLQLETQPVINEIGFGKSRREAELMTIFLMAKTLVMLLL